MAENKDNGLPFDTSIESAPPAAPVADNTEKADTGGLPWPTEGFTEPGGSQETEALPMGVVEQAEQSEPDDPTITLADSPRLVRERRAADEVDEAAADAARVAAEIVGEVSMEPEKPQSPVAEDRDGGVTFKVMPGLSERTVSEMRRGAQALRSRGPARRVSVQQSLNTTVPTNREYHEKPFPVAPRR